MLQIYVLKNQCVFGGHAEGKGTVQISLSTLLVPRTGCQGGWAPPFLENVKSQQDQILTDPIEFKISHVLSKSLGSLPTQIALCESLNNT